MVKLIYKNILILCFFLIFLVNSIVNLNANQETPQIKAVVNPKAATIGMPLEYKISIAAKNKKIKILLPKDKIFIPKNLKNEKKENKKEKEDQNLTKAKQSVPLYIIQNVTKDDNSDATLLYQTVIIKIAYYRTGKYSLPEIKFIDETGKEFKYQIPEVTISSLNKKAQLEEIEPPLYLKGNYTRLILVILGAIIFGALIVLLIIYIRKKIKAKKEAVVVLPPKIIFQNEIVKFKKANYLADNNIEAFVFELSMIFRKFLAASLKFNAVDMTNEEIFKAIEKHINNVSKNEFISNMRQLMDLWDLSKFAEFAPSVEILERNLNDTEKFVLNSSWEVGNVRI